MRVLTLAAMSVVVLAGCAQTAPPIPAALPSASTVTSASSQPSSTASSAGASAGANASGASATPSRTYSLPTVTPKGLTKVTLPATFGGYQATTATGVGEQQVVFANPADPKDVLNVVVTSLADAPTIASAYTAVTLNGPALCGTVTSNGILVASCALPLDKGAIVVTGAGTQTKDQVATATGALWAALA
jgi:hypothetical protein